MILLIGTFSLTYSRRRDQFQNSITFITITWYFHVNWSKADWSEVAFGDFSAAVSNYPKEYVFSNSQCVHILYQTKIHIILVIFIPYLNGSFGDLY